MTCLRSSALALGRSMLNSSQDPPTTIAEAGPQRVAVAVAAFGVAVGAAVAAANTGAATSNSYAAGLATDASVASANNNAAITNAYNAGVAAGAAGAYSIGHIVAAAPTGCATPNVGGMTYYLLATSGSSPLTAQMVSTIARCPLRKPDSLASRETRAHDWKITGNLTPGC